MFVRILKVRTFASAIENDTVVILKEILEFKIKLSSLKDFK